MTFTHCRETIKIPKVVVTTKTTNAGRIYITPQGKYPSITTVLGLTADKTALDRWKSNIGEEKAKAESIRASNRGSAMHMLCEYFLDNCLSESDLESSDRTGRILFKRMRPALTKHVTTVHAQEVALWSDADGFKVAGRVDLICDWDGVLSIVDFKSSTKWKDEQYIEDYFLQCTAYCLMVYYLTGIMIEQIVIIISVEQALTPQIFVRKSADYISALIDRYNKYMQHHHTAVDIIDQSASID